MLKTVRRAGLPPCECVVCSIQCGRRASSRYTLTDINQRFYKIVEGPVAFIIKCG